MRIVVRLRAQIEREEAGHDHAWVPVEVVTGSQVLDDDLSEVKLPREVAARLLLGRLFEETLAKVAEKV